MANFIKEPGDKTSHSVKPDFESGKGYYWMKQMHDIQVEGKGDISRWPRKPRSTPAERSYFEQVDRRLTRQSYTMGASFDKDGRLVRE